jgi:2-C-methyl-D-erythritol 4-phosphate cytidylyltransferase
MTTSPKDTVAVLVVAAGSGKRMGSDVPKQFIEINGKPILRLTLERFQEAELVAQIYVVTSPGLVDHYSKVIINDWQIDKLVDIVSGGTERHHSVWAGLQALHDNADIVLIHDGVRPFVSQEIIGASIQAAKSFGAAVVGVSPKDTVKRVEDEYVSETVDRHTLLLAQTPQAFQKEIILAAYENAFLNDDFSTDDAALVEKLGHKVAVVTGDRKNIKITTPEDLLIAHAFMEVK